ncbi:MAG TPA: 50S ribosome-binding GTPase, partial [Pirellulaceae bacterium]|nr:50S ribosome-binding GTPase [Pirellulaceae bacterium]
MIGGVRWDPSDTIAAIASAPGGSLRGVVRISGPDCLECVRALFRPTRAKSVDAASPSASFATLKRDSATTRDTLRSDDEPSAAGPARVIAGLVALPAPWGELPVELYWWPGVRSYTRQPTAEFHTLGSPPLVGALLAAACRSGARLAEPGEFTLRAFLAGRLDLTQAEAVLGVIDARGRTELDVALRQLAGGLAQPLQRARSELLDLLARLEAGLDFVEEDIEFVTAAELDEACQAIERLLSDVAARMRTRETAGGELRVALRGWPNVGKSSLLNALAGRTAALVSGVPGTTRDYVAQR